MVSIALFSHFAQRFYPVKSRVPPHDLNLAFSFALEIKWHLHDENNCGFFVVTIPGASVVVSGVKSWIKGSATGSFEKLIS